MENPTTSLISRLRIDLLAERPESRQRTIDLIHDMLWEFDVHTGLHTRERPGPKLRRKLRTVDEVAAEIALAMSELEGEFTARELTRLMDASRHTVDRALRTSPAFERCGDASRIGTGKPEYLWRLTTAPKHTAASV